MDLTIYGDELVRSLQIASINNLQDRQVVTGNYKGQKILGKFFHYDNFNPEKGGFDVAEDKDWAYSSLVNSINFHKLLTNIEAKLGISLSIAKLINCDYSSNYAYSIIEFLDGKPLNYKDLSREDLIMIVNKLLNWRLKEVSGFLRTNKFERFYFDSYKKVTYWLNSTFENGYFSSGLSQYKTRPIKDFLMEKRLSLILEAYKKILNDSKIKKLISSFQGIKTIQHSDIIAGWIERNERDKQYSGNLIRKNNGDIVIIDFDFSRISDNIFISLFADVIKLDFYLFDQDEKSLLLKTQSLLTFSKLGYDFDLEYSWHIYSFLQGTLWELPFWVQVFDEEKDQNKIAINCFEWLIKKLLLTSEFLLSCP